MLEINAQINTFEGGMDMDTDISVMPKNKYREAANVRLLTDDGGTTGVLLNIEDIRLYAGGLDKDETILGTAISRYYDVDADNVGTLKECGIIISKETKNGTNLNNVWVILDFDKINPTWKLIVSAELNIINKVSIVANFESNEISKIYFTDGESSLKVINILTNYNTTKEDPIIDNTYFDILPGSLLAPFKLKETISGSLPACSVLYCYQLFSINDRATTTSALSNLIPIVNCNYSDSKSIVGNDTKDITDVGCKITATLFNDKRYQRIRIFTIRYVDGTSAPEIYIINESDLPKSDSNTIEFTYNDTGNDYINKISLEEFNDYIPYTFTAKSITKLSNRLFASNIKEDTWDVNYDARAYRCNKSGQVILESNNASNTINDSIDSILAPTGGTVVTKEHDCINPMNKSLIYPNYSGDEYAFGYENTYTVRGGKGFNVKYRFVTIDLIESDSAPVSRKDFYLPCGDFNLKSSRMNISTIKLKCPDNGEYIKDITIGGNSKIRNYSDPYFVTNYLSYQRDEVYRFGIIMYNEKNIASPVHWIGDVRFPSADVPGYEPFTLGGTVDGGNRYEMVSHPLGILFEVNNLPEEVKSYEIVRCKRGLSDRTVITQGILNKTIKFNTWGDNTTNLGDGDRRPTNVPTFMAEETYQLWLGYLNGNSISGSGSLRSLTIDTNGIYDFISSDVCFNKNYAEQLVTNDCKINPLFCVSSICQSKVNNTGYAAGIPFTKILNTGVDTAKNPFGYTSDTINIFGATLPIDKVYVMDGMPTGDPNPSGGVMKYYTFISKKIASNNNIDSRLIIDISEAKSTYNITPFIDDEKDYKQYANYIGGCNYINSFSGSYGVYGSHGVNMIIYSPDLKNVYKGLSKNTKINNDYSLGFLNTTLFVNIKKNNTLYGGNSYFNRLNSIYMTTGAYSTKDTNSVSCFGGDTYLGIFDYANSLVFTHNEIEKDNGRKRYVSLYIPTESSVNLYLRSDKHFSKDLISSTINNLQGNPYYMTEPGTLNGVYSQSKPMYTYNTAYSTQGYAKKYIQRSIYAKDNLVNQNRLTCSELKTNNELVDNWTRFKFANYLDVDSEYGPITNLKTFKNRLYFFLNSAVGVASVNDRSLIQDNNLGALVLGTGGILTRFDYIVTLNGDSIINDKSIVNSENTVYWYDLDKNIICALNQGFTELSKSGKVLTYLTKLPDSSRKNPVSFYDKKYNEVWFRIYDRSLIFNEQLNCFTSFYTHNPNWFFPFSTRLVTIKDNNCYYLHNMYVVDSETKEEKISYVKFIVNDNVPFTKTFDNQVFNADLKDLISNVASNIIKDVYFETKSLETDPINQDSIEVREDNYRFAINREKQTNKDLQELSSMSYAGRMKGKYLVCNYTFDCNDNKQFKLPYIKTTYRYSML